MKMCACMIYAGVTNTSCVLEAKCVTGPNACLVRGPGNQARPISFSFALSASLSLFSTISLPHNRSDWSLTHYLTLMSSLSASLPFLTLRRVLQPRARICAADLSDDPYVRICHGSRASIYLVLCEAERREHYDDIYGDWHTSERHVRSDFLPSKLIR